MGPLGEGGGWELGGIKNISLLTDFLGGGRWGGGTDSISLQGIINTVRLLMVYRHNWGSGWGGG